MPQAPHQVGAVLAVKSVASIGTAPNIPVQSLSLQNIIDDGEDECEDDSISENESALGNVSASSHFASAVFAASGKAEPAANTLTPRSVQSTTKRNQVIQQARAINGK